MNNNELKQRLDCLEGRINRYRIITFSLAAVVLALIGIAATSPKETSEEIRAKKLVIVNDQGKESILLTAGKQGGGLVLFDDVGHPMVIAGCQETGGNFAVMRKGGGEFLRAVSEGMGGQFSFVDKSGKKISPGSESPK